VRKQLADVEARLKAASARIEQDFPEFAALANPKPLSVVAAQALIRPDEALCCAARCRR
jgi:hypothetical protein